MGQAGDAVQGPSALIGVPVRMLSPAQTALISFLRLTVDGGCRSGSRMGCVGLSPLEAGRDLRATSNRYRSRRDPVPTNAFNLPDRLAAKADPVLIARDEQ